MNYSKIKAFRCQMSLAKNRTCQTQTGKTADACQQSHYYVNLPNFFTRRHCVNTISTDGNKFLFLPLYHEANI